MNISEKDVNVLKQILRYCYKIDKTVQRFGDDFKVFKNDQDYIDSISMNLMQIGELVSNFSNEYIQNTKEIMEWRSIKGMRNLFAHDYGSMDIERIWDTVVVDIPALIKYCESQFSNENE